MAAKYADEIIVLSSEVKSILKIHMEERQNIYPMVLPDQIR